jgi:hypothetical protein
MRVHPNKWPGHDISRQAFSILYSNGLFELEIGSAVFLAWPTQTQTALEKPDDDVGLQHAVPQASP